MSLSFSQKSHSSLWLLSHVRVLSFPSSSRLHSSPSDSRCSFKFGKSSYFPNKGRKQSGLFCYYKLFLAHTDKHQQRRQKVSVNLHLSQLRSHSSLRSAWTICLQNMKYCSTVCLPVETVVFLNLFIHIEMFQSCHSKNYELQIPWSQVSNNHSLHITTTTRNLQTHCA